MKPIKKKLLEENSSFENCTEIDQNAMLIIYKCRVMTSSYLLLTNRRDLAGGGGLACVKRSGDESALWRAPSGGASDNRRCCNRMSGGRNPCLIERRREDTDWVGRERESLIRLHTREEHAVKRINKSLNGKIYFLFICSLCARAVATACTLASIALQSLQL